jgi:hypothetical protein
VLRRIQIQSDDAGGLGLKLRIVAGHVAVLSVRAQLSPGRNPLHRRARCGARNRCGMPCLSRNAERTLPASWRIEHGPSDCGRNRAHTTCADHSRPILETGESRTGGIPGTLARSPGHAGGLVMREDRRRKPLAESFPSKNRLGSVAES